MISPRPQPQPRRQPLPMSEVLRRTPWADACMEDKIDRKHKRIVWVFE